MTMTDSENGPAPPELSRRAARRLIQRATVLVGRNRHVRQHIREARVSMLWVLEDWRFEWTVILDRGKVDFDRRPVKEPDLILTWREAARFFASAKTGSEGKDEISIEGGRELRRYAELIWKALRSALGEVLKFPFDDDGVRLA
jgi:hypothetical protein